MLQQLAAPTATIIASLIAASVGVISLVISKEAKVSEFRQAWIDALRQDVASLLANLCQVLIYKNCDDPEKYEAQSHLSILASNNSLFMIRLRLNPDESLAKDLLSTLDQIEELSNQDEYPQEFVNKLEAELTEKSRLILKAEWNRVRRGETSFQICKNVLKIFIALMIFIGIYAIIAQVVTPRTQLEKHRSSAPISERS
jgi:hypothetical protein